jgi:hypothetical protein
MSNTKHPTKYIVAGNWNEFINYTKNRVDDDDTMYIYVNNVDVMRGLNEISGVFIGTFQNRPDIVDIRNTILSIKSRKTIQTLTDSPFKWT